MQRPTDRDGKSPTDRDGKSKTSSAVDVTHYPEQNEVDIEGHERLSDVDHNEIAERAHQLWLKRGSPVGSAEQDWFRAKEELRAKRNSQATTKRNDLTGSVQP